MRKMPPLRKMSLLRLLRGRTGKSTGERTEVAGVLQMVKRRPSSAGPPALDLMRIGSFAPPSAVLEPQAIRRMRASWKPPCPSPRTPLRPRHKFATRGYDRRGQRVEWEGIERVKVGSACASCAPERAPVGTATVGTANQAADSLIPGTDVLPLAALALVFGIEQSLHLSVHLHLSAQRAILATRRAGSPVCIRG